MLLILVRLPRSHRRLPLLLPRRRPYRPNPVTAPLPLLPPLPVLLPLQRLPPPPPRMLRLAPRRRPSARQLLDCRSSKRQSAPSPRVAPPPSGRRTKRRPPARLPRRRPVLRPRRSALPKSRRGRRSKRRHAPRPKSGPSRRRLELGRKSRNVPVPKPPSARPLRNAGRKSVRQPWRPGRLVVEADRSVVWRAVSMRRKRPLPRRRRVTRRIPVVGP